MDRKQIYNEIRSLGLQEEVVKTFGKNYTQCSNVDLLSIINSVKNSIEEVKNKSCFCAFDKLIEILQRKRILLNSEVQEIMAL